MTEETNFKAICGIATTVLGMPHGSLSLKTRKSLYCYERR
jgi:hypothetical protein